MPTLSAHVPDDWEFSGKLSEKISGNPYKGKPGPYIRDLIERDLASDVVSQHGFTSQQIDRWMDDEVALIQAARVAMKFTKATKAQERDALATELADAILAASLRVPVAEYKKSGYGVKVNRPGRGAAGSDDKKGAA